MHATIPAADAAALKVVEVSGETLEGGFRRARHSEESRLRLELDQLVARAVGCGAMRCSAVHHSVEQCSAEWCAAPHVASARTHTRHTPHATRARLSHRNAPPSLAVVRSRRHIDIWRPIGLAPARPCRGELATRRHTRAHARRTRSLAFAHRAPPSALNHVPGALAVCRWCQWCKWRGCLQHVVRRGGSPSGGGHRRQITQCKVL